MLSRYFASSSIYVSCLFGSRLRSVGAFPQKHRELLFIYCNTGVPAVFRGVASELAAGWTLVVNFAGAPFIKIRPLGLTERMVAFDALNCPNEGDARQQCLLVCPALPSWLISRVTPA